MHSFISQVDDEEEKQVWIDKFETMMNPLREKLDSKISEIEPDAASKNYLKKMGAFRAICIAKAARLLNPTLVAGMSWVTCF